MAANTPLRLWPGLVLAGLLLFVRLALPALSEELAPIGFIGSVVCGALIFLWWLFLSRARWSERLLALALAAIGLAATPLILDKSIATGMMGMMFPMYAVPTVGLALVAWAWLSRGLGGTARSASLAVALLAATAGFALLRSDGITGGAGAEFAWRWSATAEETLLATASAEPIGSSIVELGLESEPEWPGFRGPNRDSIVAGTNIGTDWTSSPPQELWKQPVGPGWSSFAVHGDVFYTQEQRGDEELVTCYRMNTGEVVWMHRDKARFWESNAGAGPRATPTLHDGRVYSFGGTGILNALDASDGKRLWSRNVARETGATTPDWGFSSSPLLVGDVVLVHAGDLAAYDAQTGEPRWTAKAEGMSYSSPHLVSVSGVPQIVLEVGSGAFGFSLEDGARLWHHAWDGPRILQPAVLDGGDLLITAGGMSGGAGMRRISLAEAGGGWNTEERWTSRGLKPYFNDYVVHQGHAYGFDGRILSCVELENGERQWKGGRYGQGQLVLLADQNLLLVISETGELALVSAQSGGFEELGRAPGIEGKTWNHPVVVGNTLLVRNSEQMAAFRL